MNHRGGSHGCGCGRVALGPLGTPKVVDGIEHRWGRPCRPARDADPLDTTPPFEDSDRAALAKGGGRR